MDEKNWSKADMLGVGHKRAGMMDHRLSKQKP
jgi:hypothetical protein